MTYSYDKFAQVAQRQIDKYGGTVYLNVPVDGKVNSGTGQITYNQISIPVKGLVTGYSTQDVNNINILESDKRILINVEDGKPLVNNTITANSVDYRILEVDEINPGVNQPIIYVLHVRNTTLAPDTDGFFTTLAGLEIGDIVEDPNSIRDYPKWVKVANDHHAQNITTLVEWRPYYIGAWDSGEPLFGRWEDSDMYEYLTTSYLSKLSIEFNELLQTIPVETNTFFTDSKITLLSKEELTGTTSSDGSSGSQIDYFDSNIRRVVVDYDDLLNQPWWTRDHESNSVAVAVDTEGNIVDKATTTVYYIRAMVFLQDAQIVKLNDDGETYSLVYS
jgi:hypothetical protein